MQSRGRICDIILIKNGIKQPFLQDMKVPIARDFLSGIRNSVDDGRFYISYNKNFFQYSSQLLGIVIRYEIILK
jgi:hypothetical protein